MEAATVTATPVGSPMTLRRPSSSVTMSAVLTANGPYFLRFAANAFFPCPIKHYSSVSYSKSRRRRMALGASSSHDSTEPTSPIAPLQMESPIGQFLSQILITHPHLVPVAVEQQLEQLQTDRDAEQKKEEPSTSGTDLILYRRIAEVKANERKRALEEILYTLVVQRFMDANVSLVPAITPSFTDPLG